MDKHTNSKAQECNLEKIRECQRQRLKNYKQENPDKVQLSFKRNRACLQNVMDSPQNWINDDDNSDNPGPNRERQKLLEV